MVGEGESGRWWGRERVRDGGGRERMSDGGGRERVSDGGGGRE